MKFKNLNALVTFESAARNQSYSLAAEELFISQAAVSQQMRKLEQDLQARLFIRKGRSMLLSQEGQTLYRAVAKGLGIIEQGLNDLQQEEVAGELCVTSTQAFTNLWLVPRLHKFAQLYPNISVQIRSSPGFDDLRQSHIDLAVRFGTTVQQHTSKSLRCIHIGDAQVFPMCSPMVAAQLDITSPQSLLSHWLVTLKDPGPYDWPSWFKAHGIEQIEAHQRWTRVDNTDMAINAVVSGHGVTLAAPYLCKRFLDGGQLVMPYNLPHPNPVGQYLVYDPHSSKQARLNIFIDWISQEMAGRAT